MTIEIRGKTCAVTGTLSKFTRDEVLKRLKAMGAITSASVSSKTDILFIGKGVGSKLAKARRWGVTIYNEDQLHALLEGRTEAVAALETAPKAPEQVALNDALQEFRQILYDDPTARTWQKISDLIDRCPPESLEMALEYVEGHIGRWGGEIWFDRWSSDHPEHPDLREAPRQWVEEILQGNFSPKHGLARVFRFGNRNLVGKLAQRITEDPWLTRATFLDMSHNKSLPATFFKQLGQTGRLSTLSHLSLTECRLNPSAARALVEAESLSNLTHLSLHGVDFKDGAAKELSSATRWTKLRFFDASYSRSAEGVEGFLATPCVSSLETLKLEAIGVGAALGEVLRDAGRMTRLRKLSVSYNALGSAGGLSLSRADHLKGLTSFSASNNGLNVDAVEALVQSGILDEVEQLDLACNPLGHAAALALGKLSNINNLSVSRAGLDDSAAMALIESSFAHRLTSLHMGENALGDDFVRALANATHIKGLKWLTLYNTQITDEGIEALANAPHLASLEDLYLTSAHLTPRSLALIEASPFLSEGARKTGSRNLRVARAT